MAAARRKLPTLTFYTCPTHGRYLYVRHDKPTPEGLWYTYEPTQPGQPAMVPDHVRPNPDAYAVTVCGICQAPSSTRTSPTAATKASAPPAARSAWAPPAHHATASARA